MANDITLNVYQRMALEGILSQQRGTVGEMEVFFDILERIKVLDETRESVTKLLPNGQALIDKAKATAQISEATFSFEKAEIKKIREVLTTSNSFGPGDIEWIGPILKRIDSN